MTEKEAWLYLAREFGRPREERHNDAAFKADKALWDLTINGLCWAVTELHGRDSIDGDTPRWMRNKIHDAVEAKNEAPELREEMVDDYAYLAPCDDEGDKIRVALCLKLAAELEG